ncbi:AtzH-like domain-containing protein [Polynucleobacter kasalickyi]|uniref:Oxalurate catabolism protein HpxZ n=1 Tax=Polynucleobacter kasalickyi TaxID=1938817 RepID=A0A1W1Z6W0_9BURK|nr:AtzH-like domain-containing protein [Polynucleobacter kasalickyi]SMC44135.1 Protein of unknown function [Polynucleobacter kasalickyi]
MLHEPIVNQPEVVAEITKIFYEYEQALMTNDVEKLNQYFWQDERVTRYGIGDRQWGIQELVAYRQETPAPDFTRTLEHLRVSTFDQHTAICQVEFVRSDTTLRGFQTQTWLKMSGIWRIVSAHVSMIPFGK